MSKFEKLTSVDANSNSFKTWGKKYANFELRYDQHGHLVTTQDNQILIGYTEKLGDKITAESVTVGQTWKLGDSTRPEKIVKESYKDLFNTNKPKLTSYVKVHHDHKNYEQIVKDYYNYVEAEKARFSESVNRIPEGSYKDSGTRSAFWENIR